MSLLGTRRKKTEVAEAVETIVEVETKNEEKRVEEETKLTHTAVGVFKDEKTNEWMISEIEYNPETGRVGQITSKPAGPTRDFAIELFKLTAVKKGIVG